MSLELWNKMAKPPKEYLKTIGAGRLKGKSDISPQWRYRTMTENFGPCGTGWKYTIDRQWTEAGADGEIFAFVNISLYVKVDGEWSDPIPGTGGHFLIEKETKGLHNNDEAFKMATTDALGVAMKMLGVAAEIYLGNWDGSKYRDAPPEAAKPGFGKSAATPPPATFAWSKATSTQRKDYCLTRIAEFLKSADPIQAKAKLGEIVSKLKPNDLEPADLDTVTDAVVKAEQDIDAECAGASK